MYQELQRACIVLILLINFLVHRDVAVAFRSFLVALDAFNFFFLSFFVLLFGALPSIAWFQTVKV